MTRLLQSARQYATDIMTEMMFEEKVPYTFTVRDEARRALMTISIALPRSVARSNHTESEKA